MPVDTPHPHYCYRKPDWEKIRTFAEGARAVKRAGKVYLPSLTGQEDEEYQAYKMRAEVYGATDRTIDGLEGAVFLKPPRIKLPAGADEALETDVTLAGNTLVEWLRQTVREIVTVGRYGVLIDYSGAMPAKGEKSPVQAGADRPYLVSYPAECIVNWDTIVIAGVTKLSLVVLREEAMVPAAHDPFTKVLSVSYRVLRLIDGIYYVEIWTPKVQQESPPPGANTMDTGSSPEFEMTNSWMPTRRGAPLDKIPFFFLGVSGQSITPDKPPLLDVVDTCHLHYLTSADYAHGLHWAGLPTPWVTGCSDKDKLGIGPTTAIVIQDPEAKVGMLEFTGQGLEAIEKRINELKSNMAILGARMLEEQKRAAETAEAVKLRQGGDVSVLGGISDAVSRAAEAIIARMLWWAGDGSQEPDVTIELNMDFMAVRMDPAELTALLQTWQAGGLSKESFLYNLQRGQYLPENTTVEDELAKLDREPPPGLPAGMGGGQ